jgi:hypothetical protein
MYYYVMVMVFTVKGLHIFGLHTKLATRHQ